MNDEACLSPRMYKQKAEADPEYFKSLDSIEYARDLPVCVAENK